MKGGKSNEKVFEKNRSENNRKNGSRNGEKILRRSFNLGYVSAERTGSAEKAEKVNLFSFGKINNNVKGGILGNETKVNQKGGECGLSTYPKESKIFKKFQKLIRR